MAKRTVRNYLSPDEAQLARTQLEGAGIDAEVRGDPASRALPFLGAAEGVALQVEEVDYERAVEMLGQPSTLAEGELAAHPELAPESNVPSAIARGEATELAPIAGKDAASRAFRTAIIGVFLCPGILHLYSAWLLRLSFRDWAKLDASAKRSATAAAIVDALAIIGIIVTITRL
jgi:hypothetical protein